VSCPRNNFTEVVIPAEAGIQYHSRMLSGPKFQIDEDKIKEESRYDGKWVLTTNTDLSSQEVALQYKQLWMVEQIFRSLKTILSTRPIYHKCDETIRGYVFCSFLSLLLIKELQGRMDQKGWQVEWADLMNDLEEVKEIRIQTDNKEVFLRSELRGNVGKTAYLITGNQDHFPAELCQGTKVVSPQQFLTYYKKQKKQKKRISKCSTRTGHRPAG
jgi:hypothetical protein